MNTVEVGTRWFWQGKHYTIMGRDMRMTRDGVMTTMVCAVPDEKPGEPRKPKWCDWIEESRFTHTAVESS